MSMPKTERPFCKFKPDAPLTLQQIRRQKIYNWLIAIAYVTLFFSWIFDNYYKKKWESKSYESDYMRSSLISIKTNLKILNLQVTYLRFLYLQDTTKQYVVKTFKDACLNLSTMMITERLTTIALLRLDEDNFSTEEYNKKVNDYKYLNIQMNSSYESLYASDIDNFMEYLIKTDSSELKFQKANEYRRNLTDEYDKTNIGFLWSYMIGSILLATAFLFYRKKEH